MEEVWLVKKDEKFHKYLLHENNCAPLYYKGEHTQVFLLEKYWGGEDQWHKCEGFGFYVDIKTLLSEFLVVDSYNYNHIKYLEELRDNNFKKKVESVTKVLNDVGSILGSAEINGDNISEEQTNWKYKDDAPA